MSADTQPCADSFAFFSNAPLLVQQPPAHRLLVVIPVRRDCCSWQCDSSVRVTYFTAPTSSTVEPARPGVDFIEGRGAVLFDVGQQRAQVAVEVLPALADDWKAVDSTQRAFAIVVEAAVNSSAQVRVSTEIIVEPTLVRPDSSLPLAAPIMSATYIVAGILAAAGLVALVVCWLRVRRCRLPRRARPFEYKVLLLPRRNSGASEEMREAVVSTGGRHVKKNGVRRSVRRARSFRNWWAITERYKQEASDLVVPEGEVDNDVRAATDKREEEEGSSDEAESDSEPEWDLREHLASIQIPSRKSSCS